MSKQNGTITQVVGVVVDVEFDGKDLPAIYDALEVQRDKKTLRSRLHSTSTSTPSALLP